MLLVSLCFLFVVSWIFYISMRLPSQCMLHALSQYACILNCDFLGKSIKKHLYSTAKRLHVCSNCWFSCLGLNFFSVAWRGKLVSKSWRQDFYPFTQTCVTHSVASFSGLMMAQCQACSGTGPPCLECSRHASETATLHCWDDSFIFRANLTMLWNLILWLHSWHVNYSCKMTVCG